MRDLVIPGLALPKVVGVSRLGEPIYEVAGGAITGKWYGKTILNAFGSSSSGNAPNIDYLSDTLKAMATTSSYSPDQDAHDFKDDVTNEVASGSGYTTGGVTLTGKVASYDGASNTIGFTADPIVWAAASFTFRRVVIYDDTPGTDATKPLIGWFDMGTDVTGLGGNVTLTPNASGLFIVVIA